MIRFERVAVGGETAFELPFTYTPGYGLLSVLVNGVEVAFSETDPAHFAVAAALVAGDRVELRANLPSAWERLPADWRRTDSDGVLSGVVEVLDSGLTEILHDLRTFPDARNVLRCDPRFLPYLAADLGWDLSNPAVPAAMPNRTIVLRKIAGLIVPLYRQKGTRPGMIAIIRLFLGLEVTIDALFADSWTLGESELGIDTILGIDFDTDPALALTLIVRFPRPLTVEELEIARGLLDIMKPAKAIVVPMFPTALPWWVLGESLLGMENWDGIYTFEQTLHEDENVIRLPIAVIPGEDRLEVRVNGDLVSFEELPTTITLLTDIDEGDVLTIVYRGTTVLGPGTSLLG